MTKPSAVLVLKMAAALSVREILFLPLWWYTTGVRETLGKLMDSIQGSVRYFGVDVWTKNLFVPMYGDESVTGRAISVLVRFTVLLFRSLGVVCWMILVILLALIYLMILPLALIGFFSHLVGVILSYA